LFEILKTFFHLPLELAKLVVKFGKMTFAGPLIEDPLKTQNLWPKDFDTATFFFEKYHLKIAGKERKQIAGYSSEKLRLFTFNLIPEILL